MNAKKAANIMSVLLAILLSSCQPRVQTGVKTAVVEKPTATPLPRISEYGRYQGYSEAIYSGVVESSQYIPVRDGTLLAADIYRPAVDGQAVETPLPVILWFGRYHRDQLKFIFPWYETLIRYGYVIAAVDVRGSGASYGSTRTEHYSPNEIQDGYDVIEWLASQPWSDGNIGMFGASYMGRTQFEAASAKPPHLKAIYPQVSIFDFYHWPYPGGILQSAYLQAFQDGVKELDNSGEAVAEDADGSMLAAATKDHQANPDWFQVYSAMPYRDSQDPQTGVQNYQVPELQAFVNEISDSQIPVYHRGGWYDTVPRDTLRWYANLTNPQRIVMGPWSHFGEYDNMELMFEHLRWFDYWLKGIDNGIMQEPPIRYYTMGAKEGWHTADQWPLPNQVPTSYYFSEGPSGSVNSVNDGLLSPEAPVGASIFDVYQVDYSTTQGDVSRRNADSQSLSLLNQVSLDEKGLTYTTNPLESPIEVTGHPILHLWVTSSAADGDFFVYLEDVTETGFSHYITDGNLRASYRAVSTAPYDNLGLPYHRSYEADMADLPGEPVELVIDLLPISYVFGEGHRIRITITCADNGNLSTPVLDPAPTISVYRDAEHASYIDLPVIPGK